MADRTPPPPPRRSRDGGALAVAAATVGITVAIVLGTLGASALASATDGGRRHPDQHHPDQHHLDQLHVVQQFEQPAPGAAGVVRMELVDEQYAFGPDESLHLVYRLTGDLDAVDLTPPPPPTTVPPTTAPPTTVPDPTATTLAPDLATPDTTPDANTGTPSDTTTSTVPPPPPDVRLTVEVTNYPALAGTSDIDDLIGGDVDRDAFGDAIDGVQIVDVRTSIVIADDGSATLTLDVPTDVDNSIEERLKFDGPGLFPVRTELLAGPPGAETLVATHGTIVQRVPGPGEPATIAPPINLAIVTAIAPANQDTTAADEQASADAFDDAVDLAAV
ncbi:MAG: hypothetical protein ABWZ99_07480, partial [Ilumatobacteraceae bacterium]